MLRDIAALFVISVSPLPQLLAVKIDLPLCGTKLSNNDADESGFSCYIGTKQSHYTVVDSGVDFPKSDLFSIGVSDSLQTQNRYAHPPT